MHQVFALFWNFEASEDDCREGEVWGHWPQVFEKYQSFKISDSSNKYDNEISTKRWKLPLNPSKQNQNHVKLPERAWPRRPFMIGQWPRASDHIATFFSSCRLSWSSGNFSPQGTFQDIHLRVFGWAQGTEYRRIRDTARTQVQEQC